MQLLGVIILCLVLVVPMPGLASQGEVVRCDSSKASDLVYCTTQNFQLADRELNDNYRKALASVSPQLKNDLRLTQRAWLKFRDSQCSSIADNIRPGGEAGIEESSCLAHLTSDRAEEIGRIYEARDDDEYFRMLSSLERAGYDRSELVSRLGGADSQHPEWVEYLSLNCKLLYEINKEPVGKCSARGNLYRSY